MHNYAIRIRMSRLSNDRMTELENVRLMCDDDERPKVMNYEV